MEATPPSYSFTVAPATTPSKLTCKKGTRKKTVKGKVKCAKIRHHKRHP
jgi:hypothetical protein